MFYRTAWCSRKSPLPVTWRGIIYFACWNVPFQLFVWWTAISLRVRCYVIAGSSTRWILGSPHNYTMRDTREWVHWTVTCSKVHVRSCQPLPPFPSFMHAHLKRQENRRQRTAKGRALTRLTEVHHGINLPLVTTWSVNYYSSRVSQRDCHWNDILYCMSYPWHSNTIWKDPNQSYQSCRSLLYKDKPNSE